MSFALFIPTLIGRYLNAASCRYGILTGTVWHTRVHVYVLEYRYSSTTCTILLRLGSLDQNTCISIYCNMSCMYRNIAPKLQLLRSLFPVSPTPVADLFRDTRLSKGVWNEFHWLATGIVSILSAEYCDSRFTGGDT